MGIKTFLRPGLDPDGQPYVRAFGARRLEDRQIDELLGLCRGVLADGAISEGEARFLLDWIERHRVVADRWPVNVLYERVTTALQDGRLDLDEERELLTMLSEFTGGEVPVSDGVDRWLEEASTALPLCSPAPDLLFSGRLFCLTGKFITGTRAHCSQAIADRGGELVEAPTRKTNYLVIGMCGSRDWIHSSYGRKIEKAVDLRQGRSPIAIVSEEHWAKFLV